MCRHGAGICIALQKPGARNRCAGVTEHAAGTFRGVTNEFAGGMCTQVLLDVTSIAPDRILLLDSYFYVVVFHGSSIAQWRKDGFHLNPDHAHFKELLEVRRWPPLTQHGRP